VPVFANHWMMSWSPNQIARRAIILHRMMAFVF